VTLATRNANAVRTRAGRTIARCADKESRIWHTNDTAMPDSHAFPKLFSVCSSPAQGTVLGTSSPLLVVVRGGSRHKGDIPCKELSADLRILSPHQSFRAVSADDIVGTTSISHQPALNTRVSRKTVPPSFPLHAHSSCHPSSDSLMLCTTVS
jgi:hypothetical protein